MDRVISDLWPATVGRAGDSQDSSHAECACDGAEVGCPTKDGEEHSQEWLCYWTSG